MLIVMVMVMVIDVVTGENQKHSEWEMWGGHFLAAGNDCNCTSCLFSAPSKLVFLCCNCKSQFERRLICIRANPHNLAAAITVIYNVNIREKFCTPSLVPPSNHPLSRKKSGREKVSFLGLTLTHIWHGEWNVQSMGLRINLWWFLLAVDAKKWLGRN